MSRAAQPTTAQSSLDAAVEACQHRLSGRLLLARLVGCANIVLVYFLLLVIGDHTWPGGLPSRLLVVLAVFGGAALAALVAGSALLTALRRISPLFAARHLERSLGGTHNSLINALLLRRRPELAHAQQACARQAVRDIASSEPTHVAASPRERRPWLVLAIVMGIWLLYALVSPKSIFQSLGRLFGSGASAPTVTRLTLEYPGPHDAVHVGDPLSIGVRVSGRDVDAVEIELTSPPNATDRPSVTRSMLRGPRKPSGDVWEIGLSPHEVAADLAFLCRAGDARLEGVIPVLPRPDVGGIEVLLEPPDYTGAEHRRPDQPTFTALAGTRATFTVHANVAVQNPVFVFLGVAQARTRMTVAPDDPRAMTLSTRLTESGRYRIEFADTTGYARRHPKWHEIIVVADAPPRVEITQPSRRESPEGVVDLSQFDELIAAVSDDVAVAAVDLVLDRNGRAERLALPDKQQPRRRVRAAIATGDLPVAVGERVNAWIEARDGRALPDGTPAHQVGRSRTLTLTRSSERSASDQRRRDGAQREATGTAGSESGANDDAGGSAGGDGEQGAAGESQGGDDAGRQFDSDQADSDQTAKQGAAEQAGQDGPDDADVRRFLEQHKDELKRIARGLRDRPEESQRSGQADTRERPHENADNDADGPMGRRSGSREGVGRDSGQRPESEQAETQTRDGGQAPSSGDRRADDAEQSNDSGDRTGGDTGQDSRASGERRESGAESGEETPSPPDQQSGESPSRETDDGEGDDPADAGSETAQGQPQSSGERGADERSQSGDAPPNEPPSNQNAAGDSDDDPGRGETGQGQPPGERPETETQGDSGPPRGDSGDAGEAPPQTGDESTEGNSDTSGAGQTQSGSGDQARGAQGGSGAQGDTETRPSDSGGESEGENQSGARESGASAQTGGANENGGDSDGQAGSRGNRGGQAGSKPNDSGGGGDAADNRGTSEPRGDEPVKLDESKPPPQHPLDAHQPSSTGAVEARDALETLRRRGELSDELLSELDRSPEKRAAFLEALQRMLDSQRVDGGDSGRVGRIRFNARPGDDGVQSGRGRGAGASMAADAAGRREQKLRKIAPPPDQRVNPALGRLLEAYYRSMAQQAESRDRKTRSAARP